MAKIEDLATFNLDNSTYAIGALGAEARELLSVYLMTEEDIAKLKIELVKNQHALASMGNMFRDMIKDVAPLSAEQIDEMTRQAAAQAIAANQPIPAEPAKKRPVAKRVR